MKENKVKDIHENIKTGTKNVFNEKSENQIFIDSDQEKKKADRKNQFIIGNIDSLYSNIKKPPKYIMILNISMFLLMIFNESISWNIKYMFAIQRDYKYCYNPKTHMLDLKDRIDVCNLENRTLIYLDYNDTIKITNVTQMDTSSTYFLSELQGINSKYQDLFYNLSLIYEASNVDYNSIIRIPSTQFNPCIVFNSKDLFTVNTKYNQLCNTSNLYVLVSFSLLGSLFSNILISALGDIFGRRIALKSGLILSCIGGLSLFIIREILSQRINTEIYKFRNENNNTVIENVFSYYILPNKITEIKQYNFSKLMIFYGLCIFFLSLGQGVIANSSLCLILENSINDEKIYQNYLIYYSGITFSFFFTYAFLKLSLDFELLFFVIGIVYFIYFIFVHFYILESPRYYFEYSEYIKMTDVFLKLDLDDDLGNFFQDISKKDILIKTEDNGKKKKKSLKRSSIFQKLNEISSSLKIYSNKNIIIDRKIILRNPFILPSLIYNDRELNRCFFLICSLVIIVLFINISINLNIFSRCYYTRESLYNDKIFSMPQFITFIFMLIINYIFYFVHKLFGFRIVLVLSFIGIAILCLYNQLLTINMNTTVFDQNKYDYGKMIIEYTDRLQTILKNLQMAETILANGLIYSIYIYLFKFTRTINRCLFFGMIEFLKTIIILTTGATATYITQNIWSIFMASVIGVFSISFVNDNKDFNIISDRKRIEMKN